MANQIVAVRKVGTTANGSVWHEHISAVQLDNGSVYSTEQVVAYIDQGYKFMVQVYGYRDAQVYAPRCGACARRHITTSPDGVQANNLNSLPRF